MLLQVNLILIIKGQKINLEITILFIYFVVQSAFYGRKKTIL